MDHPLKGKLSIGYLLKTKTKTNFFFLNNDVAIMTWFAFHVGNINDMVKVARHPLVMWHFVHVVACSNVYVGYVVDFSDVDKVPCH
jgi:hypothetical protein